MILAGAGWCPRRLDGKRCAGADQGCGISIRCREKSRQRVIVLGPSGNGLLDLTAYESYLGGRMHDTGSDD